MKDHLKASHDIMVLHTRDGAIRDEEESDAQGSSSPWERDRYKFAFQSFAIELGQAA